MNSLEQIPEEKENMNVGVLKMYENVVNSKSKLPTSSVSIENYSSVNSRKPLGNANNMHKILSPTNINSLSKQNIKSKSQTFSFKPQPIKLMQPVVAPEPISAEDLEDQIETLIEHQKTCQSESKYVEAEMAKQRVKELKVLLEKKTKEDIKSRHTKEMSEIQKAYLDEMDQFNAFWDKKIAGFDEDSTKIEEELNQKQEIEMSNFISDLDKSLDIRPKDNTELLSLRKVEQELAKQEDYMQAYAIKQKIAAIEREEKDRYAYERQKRMKNLIVQLKNKHTTELQALQKRIQSGKDEQVKLRSLEFERLMQKFMIAKKDLQQSQTVEVNKYSKSVKMGCNKIQIINIKQICTIGIKTNKSISNIQHLFPKESNNPQKTQ